METNAQVIEPTAPPDDTRSTRRWVWWSVLAIAALAVAAVIGMVLLDDTGEDTASDRADAEFTHVYELDGDLSDAEGGPALAATGGAFGAEGFVFGPGDALTADLHLGETYTIEFRIRVDASGHAIKLIDFTDLTQDSGLYVLDEEYLVFWFDDGCGAVRDDAQGCPDPGRRSDPMAMRPHDFVAGDWITVRFMRDGETDALRADVDGVNQSWEILFPPWDTPEDHVPVQVDHAADFMDEAVQPLSSFPLRFVQDDRATRTETGTGELDYIKIAIGSVLAASD